MGEQDWKSYRRGVLGALMDELERAADALVGLIRGLTEDDFNAVRNPDEKESAFRSIQSIVNHVIQAGYGHANYLRRALSMAGHRVEVPLATRLESIEQLSEMLEYMAATLEGRWSMTDEEVCAVAFETRWGQTYDLEQMLEHTIVHVLRHRRQIERYLRDRA